MTTSAFLSSWMKKQWRRRIRLVGDHAKPFGFFVTITDAETGLAITNISKAVITLIPGECNIVELTYHALDGDGKPSIHEGKPVEEMVRLHTPSFDLTAFEEEKESDANTTTTTVTTENPDGPA